MTILGLDLSLLLHDFGLLTVFAGVALESMGLPVPGETVLVVAAAGLAHTGHAGLGTVFLVAAAAAVLGDNLGYAAGRFGGWPLVHRYRRWLRLDEGSLKVARYLFARHGGSVVFGGRFVALLRTTAAFLAGVNHMPWRRFLFFNTAGGVAWAGLWTTLAYAFGARIAHLPAGVGWVVAAAAVAGAVAGAMVIRRRFRSLRGRAEVAYPDPL